MTDDPNNTSNALPAILLRQLLGEVEASTIVLVVDQDNNLIDYRVQPFAEIVATLTLNGFGQPAEL